MAQTHTSSLVVVYPLFTTVDARCRYWSRSEYSLPVTQPRKMGAEASWGTL